MLENPSIWRYERSIMKRQYTLQANIRTGGTIEVFKREFEADNVEGEAMRMACELVLRRMLESDSSLENIFLITNQGIVKPEWFDINVMFNFLFEEIRKKVSSAARRGSSYGEPTDNQQGRT